MSIGSNAYASPFHTLEPQLQSDPSIFFTPDSSGSTSDTLYEVPVSFLEDLKLRTFNYFWEVVDTTTWQTDDRYPNRTFTSIAATGFALPSYVIGIHNNFVSREEGAERVLNVLEWLWESPQGNEPEGMTGYKGFYYHFLNYEDGERFKQVELSTIDTALLMAGILTAQSYFDGDNQVENRIQELADSLYLRVEWNWAMNENPAMSMGWRPESDFISAKWEGYNEAMILLILALGSPDHSIPDNSWDVWTSTYEWEEFYNYEFINFGPLFGHQYSQMFVDFREIQDEYMQEKGIDYFENSRRATLSNRAYCINNPSNFEGYSETTWGLTACDGPSNETRKMDGKEVQFRTYHARGAADGYIEDDGTITPTAAGGSIPFAPEITLGTLFSMKENYGSQLYKEYGFIDSFNMTFDEEGWFNPDYLGIDQGPILIQLENLETELIWSLMKENPYIRKGLEKAGFTGGWLNESDQKKQK
ncbi:MAG: glucoamylase family protein [Balneolaceae bacterium]